MTHYVLTGFQNGYGLKFRKLLIVSQFSSSWEEEYPQGEVVGEKEFLKCMINRYFIVYLPPPPYLCAK